MKRPLTHRKLEASAETEPAAKPTLEIKWPWSMTWIEYVDEMLIALERRIGPGHPLHRRKLFVSAVREDERTWYVEGEEDPFYAIVYFDRTKTYRGKKMPLCEILPDWDAVLKRFASDHEKAMKKLAAEKGSES